MIPKLHVSTLAAALLASTPSHAGAAPGAEAASATCTGAGAPEIAAPAGHALAFALHAEGAQVYSCAQGAGAAAPAWTLQRPDATLLEDGGERAGTHGAGPSWVALDGSSVAASKVASAPAGASAVPALLLRATTHEGRGRMAEVSFVRRIATSGGVAPAEGCGAPSVGAVVRVPYRAVYCFYAPAHASPGASR